MDQGIRTEKLMTDAAGTPTVRIVEELPPITAEQYAEFRVRLVDH